MKRSIGAALVVTALVFTGPFAIGPAAAASPDMKSQSAATSEATDISARRYHRRYDRNYGYRPYYRPAYRPYYYARPNYYRPYPYYAPAPFPLGFGFGSFWWYGQPPLSSRLLEQLCTKAGTTADTVPRIHGAFTWRSLTS